LGVAQIREFGRPGMKCDDGLQCFTLSRSNIVQQPFGLLFQMVEIGFGGQRQ
jgi:hypothetical protein